MQPEQPEMQRKFYAAASAKNRRHSERVGRCRMDEELGSFFFLFPFFPAEGDDDEAEACCWSPTVHTSYRVKY